MAFDRLWSVLRSWAQLAWDLGPLWDASMSEADERTACRETGDTRRVWK